MKTAVECLPCFIRQALQVAKLIGCNDETQQQVVISVAALLGQLNLDRTPPANAIRVYDAIAAVTRCADPYHVLKKESNLEALKALPILRTEVQRAENPLLAAVRFAIAGNIIDYGAFEKIDLEAAFNRSRTVSFTIDHSSQLLARVSRLEKGASILYLADNCGEIVYDSLVLECLADYGLDITVVVKSAPIINDATREDALVAGLDRFAHIVDNGTACPGTPLRSCSPEFLDIFAAADLVIAKGQGNFETLSEVEREVFFLLTVKCEVVGRHMAEVTGTDRSLLPGDGEMVVFHSLNTIR